MAVRTATYALARPVPYLLEAGYSTADGNSGQTISAPIRYGSDGSLVTVTQSGSTVTITKPDSSDLVSAGSVVISSSIPTYTLAAGTPSTAEALGRGWMIEWALVIGADVYTFRQTAYLCSYVPHLTVSAADLYARMPELEHRVPQSQGERGSDVGWQPQIDEAWYEFLRWMLSNAREPWKITEATGHHDFVLTRALQLCVQAIPGGLDSVWARSSRDLHFEVERARAGLRLRYDDESPAIRRGASPVIRLAPTGRPTW